MISLTQDNIGSNDISGKYSEAIEDSASLVAMQGLQDTASLRYGFRIGDIGFLLAREKLGEVAADIVTHPIPNTQKWFVGMTNMRGNLVPVFDIRMLLGIEGDTSGKDKRKVLILNSGEMAVGILIDGLPVTVNPDQPERKTPQLAEAVLKYTGTAFSVQGQIWMELDYEAFFRHIGEMVSVRQCQN